MVFQEVLATILVGALMGTILFLVARRLQVSIIPASLVSVVLAVSGLAIQVSSSPFYVPSDASFYEKWALYLYDQTGEGGFPSVWPGKGVWPALMAGFYFIFGPVSVALHLFNAMIIGLILILVQKTTKLFVGKDPKSLALLALASSPAVLIFGPSLLRESLFWLGGSLGTLALALLFARKYVAGTLTLFLGCCVLLAIRPDFGLIAVYALLAPSIVIFAKMRWGPTLRSVLVVGISGLTLLASIPFAVGLLIPQYIVENLEPVRAELAGAEVKTGFYTHPTEDPSPTGPGPQGPNRISDSFGLDSFGLGELCVSNDILVIICSSLATLPNVLVGPFPWELKQFSPLAGVVLVGGTFHFLLVFFASLTAVTERRLRSPATAIIGVGMVLLCAMAAISTNYGIILRFRMIAEMVLLPLALANIVIQLPKFRGKLGQKGDRG